MGGGVRISVEPGEVPGLIDHHCHGLVLGELDRSGFESLLNEAAAPSPLGTTFFDSMLGLAVRRWCAPVLGLPAHAPAEVYLTRRRELGAEASRRLLAAAGIETLLVDTGIRDDRLCPPAELAAMAGATAAEILRLETLLEDVVASASEVAAVPEAVERSLAETGAVAAKSIAAYRVGLDLPGSPPGGTEVLAALRRWHSPAEASNRIADPVLSGWLAWAAIRARLPLQIHVGYGDADLDLRQADPLRLTPFLRATERFGVPVMLLHTYPFHRSAAYLAQVFGHVFTDLGLAVHNTGALSRSVIAETLELAPFGKLLFSTDAYGLAEFFHLGAHLYRRGLAGVLDQLVEAGEMTRADARAAAQLIGRDNAVRVYRLRFTNLPPPPRLAPRPGR